MTCTAYRTISYWLPTVPVAIAYWRLRRQFRHAPTPVARHRQPGSCWSAASRPPALCW